MADEYTPTIAEVREAWGWLRQEVDEHGRVVISFEEAGDEFDRCLAQRDREVKAVALREAADEVHREGRWAIEQQMRGRAVRPAERMGVVEIVLRDWADRIERGEEP